MPIAKSLLDISDEIDSFEGEPKVIPKLEKVKTTSKVSSKLLSIGDRIDYLEKKTIKPTVPVKTTSKETQYPLPNHPIAQNPKAFDYMDADSILAHPELQKSKIVPETQGFRPSLAEQELNRPVEEKTIESMLPPDVVQNMNSRFKNKEPIYDTPENTFPTVQIRADKVPIDKNLQNKIREEELTKEYNKTFQGRQPYSIGKSPEELQKSQYAKDIVGALEEYTPFYSGMKIAVNQMGEGVRNIATGKPLNVAAGLVEGSFGLLNIVNPELALFNEAMPEITAVSGEIAEKSGFTKEQGQKVAGYIAPFLFGKYVGLGSITSEIVTDKVEEAGWLDKLNAEDHELAKKLISNGLFLAVATGGNKVEGMVRPKANTVIPETTPKETIAQAPLTEKVPERVEITPEVRNEVVEASKPLIPDAVKQTADLPTIEEVSRGTLPEKVDNNLSAINELSSKGRTPEEISKVLNMPIKEVNQFVDTNKMIKQPKIEESVQKLPKVENVEQKPTMTEKQFKNAKTPEITKFVKESIGNDKFQELVYKAKDDESLIIQKTDNPTDQQARRIETAIYDKALDLIEQKPLEPQPTENIGQLPEKLSNVQYASMEKSLKDVPDLRRNSTGWKIFETKKGEKGFALINPGTKEYNVFNSYAEAQSHAIDNPIVKTPMPEGEIITKNLVQPQGKPEQSTLEGNKEPLWHQIQNMPEALLNEKPNRGELEFQKKYLADKYTNYDPANHEFFRTNHNETVKEYRQKHPVPLEEQPASQDKVKTAEKEPYELNRNEYTQQKPIEMMNKIIGMKDKEVNELIRKRDSVPIRKKGATQRKLELNNKIQKEQNIIQLAKEAKTPEEYADVHDKAFAASTITYIGKESPNLYRYKKDWLIDEHKDLIEQAIKEGKQVPEEVLKDYPDLAKKPELSGKAGQLGETTQLIGSKNLSEYTLNKLSENKKTVDRIFELRESRKTGTPSEKRKTLTELQKEVANLRKQGIHASLIEGNLFIDRQKVFQKEKPLPAEKIEDVEIANIEAEKPFKKLSNEEVDKQTMTAELFSEKKYLPEDLKRMLPVGFGQKKLDKAISDIKKDDGLEQSKEAQILRDFSKEIEKRFDEQGYIEFSNKQQYSKEEFLSDLEDYATKRGKETGKGETTFEFGKNVSKEKIPQIEKTKAGDQYTLGSEMKPSFPTKAKFEGKTDLSEETPLFKQEKVDKEQINVFEEPIVQETSESLTKGEVKAKEEIKPPKGSNAVKVEFESGKSSLVTKQDVDTIVEPKNDKIKNVTYGNVEFNKQGGIKPETFKKIETKKPKNFSEIVNDKSNEILESEKTRMQKESLGSGELKSTFIPFSSLIDKLTNSNSNIPRNEIASSGNEKIDRRFITNTPTWREKRLENARHISGLVKEKLQFLHDVKSDPTLRKMKVKDIEGKESSAIDYLSTEVDILKQKLTAGVKDTTRKTLYSIFGDMNKENLEKGIYNVGKYAGIKRLKAITEDISSESGVREKILKEYSKEEINKALTELEKNLTPEEKRSYERMNELLSTYGEELVSEGLIEKTTTDYFPFRVIDFIDKVGSMNTRRGMFRKETPQSSLKFTGGSAKHAVNIDVMQVLSDYFRQNERAKAINEFEKTVLQKFHNPDMKGKDGWTEYEFNPKRGYIKLYSAIEKIMRDAAVDLPKDVKNEIGRIFFGGGKNYTVPEGLSKQLSNLYTGLLPSQVPIIGEITRQFKKQMVSRIGLFNLIFQARNMRTDMKKVINNNPASFSSLPQTEKFLFKKMNLLQQGYLHFIDLASFNKITKQVGRIDRKARGIDIKPEQMESAYKEFEESGLGGRLTTEAYEITDKDFNRKFLMQGLKQNLSEFSEGRGISGFLEGFDKTMQMRETILRFNQYVYDRHIKGLSKAEAHENVARTFINYNHFTEFENKWLRNLFIPFYSWAKGNPEMTYESFAKGNRNTKARILAGLLLPAVGGAIWNRIVAPEDEEKLNNDPNKRYIAENFHFATNWFDKNGNRIYIFDQSWEDDITNYVNLTGAIDQATKLKQGTVNLGDATANYMWDTFHGNVKTGLNYISPVVKAPFEITMNKNIYSGYPIWKEDDESYNKMIKLAMYEGFAFDRNASTIRNLFVGKQDWSMKGMRLSGLPVTSIGLEKSPSNFELMNKEIFKERIQEITDFEKERDKLKEKVLKEPTKENRYLYNKANEKLTKMRKDSDAYQEHLDELREKREQEEKALGIDNRQSRFNRIRPNFRNRSRF
jgi:hypothetical protein